MLYIWIYFVSVNIIAFAVMGIDKKKAKKGLYRIAESTLWTLALVGGASGSTFAMYYFRHKTRHLAFKIGFPLIAVVQIIAIVFLISV